jgi:RhtB (resistance to homoserine/threonine) family protein
MLSTQFLAVAGIHLFAVMSPGPDFAMVTRNSVIHSRRIGIFTALGIAIGMTVHIAYSLVGIGYVIARSIIAFNAVKYIGAGYLMYIGCKSLMSAKPRASAEPSAEGPKRLGPSSALRMGVLTEITNPKATLFFLALFTQVIDPRTPRLMQMAYGAEMFVVGFAWFVLVALFFSHQSVRSRVGVALRTVEKFFGAALLALGVKVAFSHRQ